ncbi:MAG: RIP metalloprotease RseP [Methylococcales bacterium]
MMTSFLHTSLFFVVALAILIAFHEFGHFWVARKLGVKVIRFSIGFGKPIHRFQKDSRSTEFVIAAIPLGGYVKMVDEREGEVSPEDLPHAFNRQSLVTRAAIVLAGPLFNLFLAVLIFWAILVSGETGIRPLLGDVEANTIASRSGFEKGEEVLEVDGEKTPTWNHAIAAILAKVVDSQEIPVKVRAVDGSTAIRILMISEQQASNPASLADELGFRSPDPKVPPRINDITENSPAAKAGIEPGDLILSANGIKILGPSQFVEIIRANPAMPIQTVLERNGLERSIELIPEAIHSKNAVVGRIGASVGIPAGSMDYLRVEYKLGLLSALSASIAKVTDFSVLTIKMLGKMLIGHASVENLSGPISIAKYAGESATMGLVHFLKFIAIVSISLGVLNLMPIPILDGGHLLFIVIEGLKGKPLSEHAQLIGQQVGMALLICLMVLAFYLDIERLVQ